MLFPNLKKVLFFHILVGSLAGVLFSNNLKIAITCNHKWLSKNAPKRGEEDSLTTKLPGRSNQFTLFSGECSAWHHKPDWTHRSTNGLSSTHAAIILIIEHMLNESLVYLKGVPKRCVCWFTHRINISTNHS